MRTIAKTLQEGDRLTLRLPKWEGRGAWAGNRVLDVVVVKVTNKSATLALPDGSTTIRRLRTLNSNQVLRDGDARQGENMNLFEE